MARGAPATPPGRSPRVTHTQGDTPMMTEKRTEVRYLSCAETAKLVRVALKAAFPGVRFSVRSDNYAGGASMRVRWFDGPAAPQVEAVAKDYQGGDFDG